VITSCPVVSNLRATIASAIISVTPAPIMRHLTIHRILRQNYLYKPSGVPEAFAFRLRRIYQFLIHPFLLLVFSVKPTEAISG
jgi:hypothetical protein